MRKKTVIIGGVAGGATAAARLRRRDEEMEIIVFEKGGEISYANCGLPYYIGDVIKSRDALLLQTPARMKSKFNIDVRVHSEVVKINPEEKKVIVKKAGEAEPYEESYDTLIIATGSSPIRPSIEGIEASNVFTLWNVPDTDAIKEYLNREKPKSAAVIGGGFIGIEMAENLHAAGLSVTMIEMQNQVMPTLDFEMAQLLHEQIRSQGVELILSDGMKALEHGEKTKILLNSGKSCTVDMVILSIGIKPNSKLAKEANLVLNERGGIVVNEYLQTSDPSIYAVGDVIEVENPILSNKTMIPLAGPANKQARIAADNIAGDNLKYQGTMGTSVAKVFDLTSASVGVNERMLTQLGKKKDVDYHTALIYQKSHAGYYPGATTLALKLIFGTMGQIYGGQIVGVEGADKRIDTLATVMKLGGKVHDLTELELAYAPPFSSAKDPVNMLGFTAENILNGLVSFIEPKELDEILAEEEQSKDYIVLDVTEEVERMVYQIPKSYHIPLGQLRQRLDELDKNKTIVPYCAIGVRSYNAARILEQHGFHKVKVLSGGTSFYKAMHHEVYFNAYKKNEEDMRSEESLTNGSEKVEAAEAPMKRLQESEALMGSEALKEIPVEEIHILDCCGLQCPGPILKVNETLSKCKDGEVIKVTATDMGFARDVEAWCRRTGNTLVKVERGSKENTVYIKKGNESCSILNSVVPTTLPQGKTIIVFSGDLDKVLASFIIANGARALGRPVTMFFTFWGLNALRKPEKVKVKKPFMDRMFGAMMPRGSKKLKLSKLNMGGMGTKMMQKVMKDKNVNSVEELMMQALKSGIKLVACTMSMDVMGITKEELIDGVEFAGVATYLGDAEESNVNLFV